MSRVFCCSCFLPATCSPDDSSLMPSLLCSVPRAWEALVCGHEAGGVQGVKTRCELALGCHPPGVAGTSCLCLLAADLLSALSSARGWLGGPAFTPVELFL